MAAFPRCARYFAVVCRTGVLLLALTVAGCASVQDFVGVPHAGYQSNGTYVLSSQEKELGCRHLHERSDGLIAQMKALPARAVQEIQDAPSNLADMFGRAFGESGDGLKAVDTYNRSYAEAVALNEHLAERGCSSTDIDAHLGQASEQMAFVKR